jgi:hypothetical protein
MFDTEPYEVALPKYEGHRASTIKLGFFGVIEVDPYDNERLEYFNSLRFADEIELGVSATVSKDVETGQEEIVNTISLKVTAYDKIK